MVRNRFAAFIAVVVLLSLRVASAHAEDRQGAESALAQQMERAILAADEVAPTDGSKLHFSLEGMWLYGPVSGYMQTPSGGKTGTTSSKRPTLKELGIDNASVFDAELTGEIGNQGFYLGG